MNRLTQWIGKTATERKPGHTPYSSLFDGKMLRYFFQRCRLLFVVIFLQVIFHALRYAFIAWKFPIFDFSLYFAYTQLLMFAEAFWWGYLDERRDPTENLHANLRYEVQILIRVFLVAIAALVFWQVHEIHDLHRIYSIFNLLFAVELVRVISNSFYMTAQAPLQARLKIPFPIPYLIVVESVSLIVLAGLFPVVGPWSIPISMIVQLVLRDIIRWWRLLNFYRQLKVPLHFVGKPQAKLRVGKTKPRLLHGLGSMLIRFDHLILILSFLELFKDGENQREVFLLQILSPLFKLSGDWARVLFFDLRRNAGMFQKWALLRMLKSAHGMGLLLGVILGAIGIHFLPEALPLILALTLARSWMSIELFVLYLMNDFLTLFTGALPVLVFFVCGPKWGILAMLLWSAYAWVKVKRGYHQEVELAYERIRNSQAVYSVSVRAGIRTHDWIRAWNEVYPDSRFAEAKWVANRRVLLFVKEKTDDAVLLRQLMRDFPGSINELKRLDRSEKSELPEIDYAWWVGNSAPKEVRAIEISEKKLLLLQAFESALLNHPIKSSFRSRFRAFGVMEGSIDRFRIGLKIKGKQGAELNMLPTVLAPRT